MTVEPRPEVVQALTSALMGDPAGLDDLTAVTAEERRVATALVGALLAVEGDEVDRRAAAVQYLADHGLADVSLDAVARDHADAWRTYQRIVLTVDELD